MSERVGSAGNCPQCGGALARIRRLREDRDASLGSPMRRYRCAGPDCGWEGLLAAPTRPAAAERRKRRAVRSVKTRRVRSGVVLASALGLAAAAVASVQVYKQFLPDPALARIALRPVVPFGTSHDGQPISPAHPLLRRAVFDPAAEAAAVSATAAASALGSASASALGPASATAAAPAIATPAGPQALELRQDCAWGDPGRNPYKGTVEQALKGARLPPEIVAKLGAQIRAGKVTDRLEITNTGIRGVHEPREYSARSIGMTFGNTLCMNTRVNFRPGHMERADLYEVADAAGETYSVMVPYACGNVSVLAARAERDPDQSPIATTVDGKPLASRPRDLLAAVTPGTKGSTSDRNLVGGGGKVNGTQRSTNQVPEPATLLNLAAGGALLAWFVRRRRTRVHGNATGGTAASRQARGARREEEAST